MDFLVPFEAVWMEMIATHNYVLINLERSNAVYCANVAKHFATLFSLVGLGF